MFFLGSLMAISVFAWRFVNVPNNWAYVNNTYSWLLVGCWLVGHTLHLFLFCQVKGRKLKIL